MNNDDLQLLADFRADVPAPDDATAERIYRLATTTRSARRRPLGLQVTPQFAGRKRLIALSAAAAAGLSLVAALLAVTLSTAPGSAYAAARKAVAATSAGTVDSGTMTLAFALGGTTRSDLTTRWNGNDISMSVSTSGLLLGGDQQVELVGGEVYVQGPDGTWLHYASESDVAFPADQMLQLARDYASGSRPDQIVALVPGLQEMVQPDGSTVFTGTIPAGEPAEVAPTDEPGVSLGPTLPHFRTDAQFQMVVGSDGLVRQISENAQDGTWTWTMQYSQLGSTSPISAPATSTEATPGTPPPPNETVPETVPYPTDTTAP